MPRATSPESESESERIPSKKQKKRDESPVDDPMDEDEGEEGEYEIEAILDSSKQIFPGETAYYVKWKGYDEEENSWVRESDAPNADELIATYKETLREKAAAKKKAAAKPRKSTEPSRQEPKKRARVSTKSKHDSDDEEPERSPVQPIAKKPKKTSASAKKKQVESNHDVEDLGIGDFASMDKYMDLDSWDGLIDSIDTIERDDKGNLFVYGSLTTKEHFRLSSTTCNNRFPQKIIKFYEDNLRWKASEEAA